MVILHCHILQFLNSHIQRYDLQNFENIICFLSSGSLIFTQPKPQELVATLTADLQDLAFCSTHISINLERDVPYSGMVLKVDHFNCSDTRRNLYHESRRSHEFTSVMCYTSLLLLILLIHNQLLKYTFIICRYNLETSTKC